MKVININSPNNVFYPLSKEILENIRVVYHGTSDIYTRRIESKGWKINDPVYDMKDIKTISDFFDSICYANSWGYVNLRSFSIGVNNQHFKRKFPSFSQNYWIARHYANNPGGETLKALIIAVDDIIKVCSDLSVKSIQLKKLTKEIEKANHNLEKSKSLNLPLSETSKKFIRYHQNIKKKSISAIKLLNDQESLEDRLKVLQTIKNKYFKYVQSHYGVVYAVKVEPDWFKSWSDTSSIIISDSEDPIQLKFGIDLFAKLDIPYENIIVRINFLNGITRFRPNSFGPLPTSWNVESFKNWLAQNTFWVDPLILKEYLQD